MLSIRVETLRFHISFKGMTIEASLDCRKCRRHERIRRYRNPSKDIESSMTTDCGPHYMASVAFVAGVTEEGVWCLLKETWYRQTYIDSRR
jgi:hypothetical protein